VCVRACVYSKYMHNAVQTNMNSDTNVRPVQVFRRWLRTVPHHDNLVQMRQTLKTTDGIYQNCFPFIRQNNNYKHCYTDNTEHSAYFMEMLCMHTHAYTLVVLHSSSLKHKHYVINLLAVYLYCPSFPLLKKVYFLIKNIILKFNCWHSFSVIKWFHWSFYAG